MADHVADGLLVVIGSGMSGYTLVRQVRANQPQRPVTLITADGGEVYSKPLLSNALAKAQTPEKMVQKNAEQKAAELGCTLLARSAVHAIDAVAQRLSTAQGPLGYDQLVLATGAHQRAIVPTGADPAWIQTVNSLDDFRSWYPALTGIERVLLIGAGLIGCEFADDLMSHGLAVELVDPAPWPLARLLPEELGSALRDALTERGARLHMGRVVSALALGDEGRYVATLDDGTTIIADRVLSATGLVPETALARSAGLACNLGVLVDRQLRSSDPQIYALGDCAETPAGYLPYILPIMTQARCLADVLAGKDAALTMKAMPVMVKTTSLPLVVCPARQGAIGSWTVEGSGRDLTAYFRSPEGAPLGFAVTGAAVKTQATLAAGMPPLLAG